MAVWTLRFWLPAVTMPVAIDEENNFYFWGNTRLRQDAYESNSDLNGALRRGELEVKQLEDGNQFSIILDTQGNVYLWGNSLAMSCSAAIRSVC